MSILMQIFLSLAAGFFGAIAHRYNKEIGQWIEQFLPNEEFPTPNVPGYIRGWIWDPSEVDEATSALDCESELIIQQIWMSLMRDLPLSTASIPE